MAVDVRSQRKAELHCHIDGLLDPAMLDELARGGEPLAIDPAALGINTDDPGPFACSLTSELELVAGTFGLGAADLARIFDHTMRAAFADR